MRRTTIRDLADRAWLAWHSLPRERGKPPKMRAVEKSIDPWLSNGALSKLFKEEQGPSLANAPRFAEALKVEFVWFHQGIGEPPVPTGPVPNRRAEMGIDDPLESVAQKAEALGSAAALVMPKNLFEVAVSTLVAELSPEAIRKIADLARGIENTKPPHHWGRLLRDAEAEVRREKRAALPPAKKKRAPLPQKHRRAS